MSFLSSINVRERPPLRLAVELETPGGRSLRFGERLHDPRHSPQNLSFSTSMPGGFEQASFDVANPWREELKGLELLSTARIVAPHGGVAWEGRLDGRPDTTGLSETVSPQFEGWQGHLSDDNSLVAIYITQDLSQWAGPSASESEWLSDNNWTAENLRVGKDRQGYPALVLALAKGPYSHPHKPRAEAWFDAGDAKVAKVWYDITWSQNVAGNAGNFSSTFGAGGDDNQNALGEFTTNLLTDGSEQSGTWNMSSSHRFIRLYFEYTQSPWAASHEHSQFTRVALIGDHGITVQAGNPIGLLASDIIGHAVRMYCPMLTFSKGHTGTVKPSKFAIPELAYLSPATAAQVIDDTVTFENLDWAVWEGRTFHLAERGHMDGIKHWRARVGPTNLQEAGPQSANLWNGVVVTYTDRAGNSRAIGPPNCGLAVTHARLRDNDPRNPANQLGINRYGTIDLSVSATTSDKMEEADAVRAGEAYLDEQKRRDTSGSATITGHVEDDRGVIHPYWRVRAGDYVSFTDAHDTSPRRVVSTSCDDSSKANSISLDQPPDTLTALLQRISVHVFRNPRHHKKHHHHHKH